MAYALPDSPYALLFAWAGYEYNDVVSLVEKEGLEDALQALYHPGIYLSFEELRGTVPVQRGSLTLQVGLDQLVNPRIARGLLVQRGARNRVTGIRLDKEAFRGYRPRLPVRPMAFTARRVRGRAVAHPVGGTLAPLVRILGRKAPAFSSVRSARSTRGPSCGGSTKAYGGICRPCSPRSPPPRCAWRRLRSERECGWMASASRSSASHSRPVERACCSIREPESHSPTAVTKPEALPWVAWNLPSLTRGITWLTH